MKEKIIEALKAKLNRRVWESWFSTFDVKDIQDNVVVFQVGNLFIKDWLEKKYGQLIAKTLREVFDKPVEYRIEYTSIQQDIDDNDEPVVKKRPLILTPLNPILTFENFVVGPNNMFAYSACLEVAKNPGKYNPLFLYGGVGLGKTHLIQAIGHYLFKYQPDLRVIYLTSERFLNELVDSIKKGKVQEFREKFRTKIDVLLLDDIQFLTGKMGIQMELFHTFNDLYNAGKQIVICSDRDPSDLNGFQDRLISRFQMGVVAKLEKPDEETSFKIARKMVEIEGGQLDEEVLRLVARYFSDNLRRLRGSIVKLLMHQQITGEQVNCETAKQLLDINPVGRNLNLSDKLIYALCEEFSVSPQELLGNSRRKDIIIARQIGIYVAKNVLGLSLRQVAELFNKSHPTVSHAIEKVKELLESQNQEIKSKVEKISKMISVKAYGQIV
ncbi:chromosomal replication initiator protein DnaA [Pseudothermotoga thermarum]|uniref:Chromosomal replication initiator protein DnaA n=1 Tax=Pseudothermotoga thermarum DSM 5069 TaxID=688269 RepID=F7YTD1_9THEM|nr:chromosomal replication initiator protein DnaA [Pseudothermotoga thermarum]AEH50109.1 chromosomal replication initiator protein DnaA [Pseudothermotoga thermarum DSM 5069]